MQNIEALLEAIRADYKAAQADFALRNPEHAAKMQASFDASVAYSEGKKYIRVEKDGSVWGFIVNVENDPKFKYGDILKAASWKTPAKNFRRGNVVEGDFKAVRWTGA